MTGEELAAAHYAVTDAIDARLRLDDPDGGWTLTDYVVVAVQQRLGQGVMAILKGGDASADAQRAHDLVAHALDRLIAAFDPEPEDPCGH